MAFTSNQSSAPVRKRRSYTAVACERCQRRKIKCSGGQPCDRCRGGTIECTYPRTTRFRTARHGSTGSNQASAAAPATDPTAWQPQANDDNSSSGGPSNTGDSSRESRPTSSPVPGSFDYYIRLAESRFAAQSPDQSVKPQTSRPLAVVGLQQLREVISLRNTEKSEGGVLELLGMETWAEVLRTYDEEIGMQYPVLDIEAMIGRIRTARETKCRDDRCIEDIACLVICLVSCLTASAVVDIASPLVHEIFSAAIVRVHTEVVEEGDLVLLILASMFFFLSDREVEAWRCIGTVMRLLHEMCTHSSEDHGVSGILYWTAYTLDRRWSFGTGLPFAFADAETTSIRLPVLQGDESLSSAYLKQMVAYCRISSETRRALLDPPPVSTSRSPVDHDASRDFAHFRIIQWQNNIPKKLRFRGVDDKFDPTRETRGEYKLRLMLYLRANQMRTLILRKSATVSTFSHITSIDDASSAHTVLQIAQDTIRVLVYLGKETDIYHAQHRTFNHFLETALSFLLLIVCCAGPTSRPPACFAEVVAAMDLIRQLSEQSHITRKLHDKLQVIRRVVDGLKPLSPNLHIIERPSAEAGPTEGDNTNPPPGDVSTSVPQAWMSTINLDTQNGVEAANPAATASYPGFSSYAQGPDTSLHSVGPNDLAAACDPLTISDSSSSDLLMGGGGVPSEMNLLPELDESRFRELNDILMDYESFAF